MMKNEWSEKVFSKVETFFQEATDQDIVTLLGEIDYDFYRTVETPVLDFIENGLYGNNPFILEVSPFFAEKPVQDFSKTVVQQWNVFDPTAADENVRYLMAA